jgi:hemolysin D
MDIVVSVQGKVIPSGKSKVVQSLEPGVVRSIAVRDGQLVHAGEVLLELDARATDADRNRLQHDLWEGETDILRANAMLAGSATLVAPSDVPSEMLAYQQALLVSKLQEQRSRLASLDADIARRQADLDALSTTLAQLGQSLPLVEQKNAMREELASTGHIARNALLDTQLELVNARKEQSVLRERIQESRASLRASVQQRAQAVAEFRARAGTELVEAVKRRDATRQELAKAEQRRELQTLRAPIDGTVQQLAVTTEGGVVTAAQPLLTIVPENAPLELEAQVLNRDVGHVRPGQRVVNKVETFDFTRYGYIDGEVLWVGTDAVQDQKLGLVYPVRVRLSQLKTPNAVNGLHGLVTAGMNVTADIRTDGRRLIDYVLAPLMRYQQEAMRER